MKDSDREEEMSGRPGDGAGEDERRGNYSLDEMVRVLKDREREQDDEGEWVVREDGSRVRRVRRRKRRSKQPEKEKAEKAAKRNLILQIGGLLSLVLISGAYLGFVYFKQNSDGFREGVEQNVGETLGAETEISQLRVGSAGASAKSMDLKWGGGSYLASLSLTDLSADVGLPNFLRSKLKGRDAGAKMGELTLQVPSGEMVEVGSYEVDSHPHFFDVLYCQAFSVVFGEESAISFSGADATLSQRTGTGYQLITRGGDLKVDQWTTFPLNNALLVFQPDAVELVHALFSDPTRKGGELDLSGEIPLDSEREYQLFLKADDYPMSAFFGERLNGFISGRLSTEQGVIKGQLGEDLPSSVVVPFRGSAVTMAKLPMWSALHELFPDEKLLEPEFPTAASGIFQWSPLGVGLRQLKFQNAARYKVTGDIAISHDGFLVGNLSLSINKGILGKQAAVLNSPAVETTSEDTGYGTVEVKLGGTINEPTDNFRELIGMSSGPRGGPQEAGTFEDLFQELTEDSPN